MDPAIRRAIARVDVVQAGRTLSRGTAALVAPDLILSALHVVADRSTDPPAFYPGQITLTFPGGAVDITIDGAVWDRKGDWVVLRCPTPPAGIRPIPLADAPADGAAWESYGFPDANPRDGMATTGTVEHQQGELDGVPAFQLFSKQAAAGTGAPVKGLSGGPVIAENAIVAVLRFALMREGQTVAGTLYGCPIALVLDKMGDRLPVPDPCRGLPGLPRLPLPPTPYRGLDHFTAADAEIFFGRNGEIRDLYQRVVAEDGAPIVLLYGQSGVGKSSFLDAGLVPRLQWHHEVAYAARDRTLGLTGTLTHALAALAGPDAAGLAPRDLWTSIEQARGRPLTMIVDQVEEAFTLVRDEPGELETFVDTLGAVFGGDAPPTGKVVLGFRKEWFPEIQKQLDQRTLAYGKVFVERLDHEGIVECVSGLGSTKRLRDGYGVAIEPSLAVMVADDLTADRDSPIAPTLQILLTKMWAAASAENAHAPVFTAALYQALKKEGFQLGDFLDQQLEKVAQAGHQGTVGSGLAYDVLAFHTTSMLTAEQRERQQVLDRYSHLGQTVPTLIDAMKRDLLLSEPAGDRAASAGATRLAHDRLAPIVRARFDASHRPGQRARRVLESRAPDWTGHDGVPLDETDLTLVERGRAAMRALTSDELRLVDASVKARHDAKRARLNRKRQMAGAALVVVGIALVAGWLYLLNQHGKRWANLLMLQAAVPSWLDVEPPKGLVTAILAVDRSLAVQGYVSSSVQSVLHRAVETARERDSIVLDHVPNAVAMSPEGVVAAGTSDGKLYLWNSRKPGEPPTAIQAATVPVGSVAFSPDGGRVAAAMGRDGVGVWTSTGQKVTLPTRAANESVAGVRFTPDGRTLITTDQRDDGTIAVHVRALDGTIRKEIPLPPDTGSAFAVGRDASDKPILVTVSEGTVRVWDLDGRPLAPPLVGQTGSPTALETVLVDGHLLVASSGLDGTVAAWDVTAAGGALIGPFRLHHFAVNAIAFDRDGRRLLFGGDDGQVRTLDFEGNEVVPPFDPGGGKIVSLALRPGEDQIAVALDEGSQFSIRLVDTTGTQRGYRVRRATNGGEDNNTLTGLAFLPDGLTLVASGLNRMLSLWTVEPSGRASTASLRGVDTGHPIQTMAIDPVSASIVTGGEDGVHVWSTDGRRLGDAASPPIAMGTITALSMSPDGARLVGADDTGWVVVWDARTRKPLRWTQGQPVTAVAFNHASDRFATGDGEGAVTIWTRDGATVGTTAGVDRARITALVFWVDDTRLISGSGIGDVLVRGPDGAPRGLPVKVHIGPVEGLTAHADSNTVYAATSDGLRFVDVSSDSTELVAVQSQNFSYATTGATVNQAGTLVALATNTGYVVLVRASWPRWLADACNRLKTHPLFRFSSTSPHLDRQGRDIHGVDCRAAFEVCDARVYQVSAK